ncbi:hypothetical protein ETAA8_55740 [Anatilimnocola aggregata]|uniref:Uncharacterized protein n=1 Tax=Anatilimnocola aggregata TaxID=2528021 RepID=A0A517YJM7_9BACT|nr:hypothetical protein [Anatilimnocola aggregata]QDU30434.1 hypothetical protein ETAA8_55740 [Anatilimnocola aggregata]
MKIYCALLCALFIAFVATVQPALANPSTKDPEALLRIRPGEAIPGDFLRPDYQAINQRYQRAKIAIDELWDRNVAKKLTLADARKVGPAHLLTQQLRRDAEFLKLRAEAAGWDLAVRLDDLGSRLSGVINSIINLPGFPSNVLSEQINRDTQIGLKRLPQIDGLIKRNEVCRAEGELAEIVDSLSRNTIWFPGTNFNETYRPFQRNVEAANQLRREQASKELKEVVAQSPDLAQLQAELTAAAASIGSSGQAMFGSQMLAGPELILAWHERWPKVQAAAQRGVMAQIAIERINPAEENLSATMFAARQKFIADLPKTMAGIIQADAQRTSGADAAGLYSRYVASCAQLCSTGPRRELQAALEPALQSLAAKGGRETEVVAYRNATEPLLAWQRLLARARAKSLAKASPPVSDWCTRMLSTFTQQGTIIPDANKTIGAAQVISSANAVLPPVLPQGPSEPVVFADLVPVNSTQQRWVARYRTRVFGLVAAPPAEAWKAETDRLEQLLLASAQALPITLDAATALATAKLGAFESAGGPIDQVTLEPLLTRFITLPDEAASLLPRDEISESAGMEVSSLAVRFDLLKPQWFQHDCFVLVP